jgi:hypothetical protein
MDKQLRHVMIDLETMGTTPQSAIVSIGAIVFDPRYGKVSKETFYRELDWEDQERHICPETTAWWKDQSAEAKAAHYGLDALDDVLKELAEWLPKDCKVWVTELRLISLCLRMLIASMRLKSLGSFGMSVIVVQYWICMSLNEADSTRNQEALYIMLLMMQNTKLSISL